ncbi:hypothetical protein PVK06_009286 [Gossypium arboreum]|uniref:Reverse transcriptase domain-containing protein n=1 Tax=Gossypium arboreum TaxID=29729 RepID=A0ABR0QM20_GOSAR|nr:hypothetical protein PVK06_009286 [Gossypium arboreum]
MEDSIAGLSLDDEEEEVIQLEVDEASKEISYANCLVGRFLTSSVGEDPIAVQLNWVEYWVLIYDFPLGFMAESVAQQLGNFIGEFCEYDTVAVQLGYKRIMRIRFNEDFDEEMVSREETSNPIVYSDGLKQPRVQSTISRVSGYEDLNENFGTSLQGGRMEKVRRKCSLLNGIDVDSDGRSEELSLGWNSDCKITLRSFSRRHIDVMIEEDLVGKTWRWDFNEIVFSTKKKGGLSRREKQMCRFQEATDRRRRNRVKELEDSEGNIHKSNVDLLELATNYFKSLFTSKGVGDPSAILEEIEPCISQLMMEDIKNNFSYEEVCLALKEMSPLKSSGDDGLGAIFYQRFWHIVGKDVADFCIETLHGLHNIADINSTRIVLIPKFRLPRCMTQFRPISLCNILYKIISKMLANRLQKILHLCIDETQSAFIPRRLITDNIIIAYEVLHSMKRKRVGSKGSFALKLDMSKAYNWIEWGFVQAIFQRTGFLDRWVENVMRCVSSVSYSVVMNGEVGNIFFPSRGLRQGDPISPYLFLICNEGLLTLLQMAATRGDLNGFRVNKFGPRITHLFFVDGNLIFGDATIFGVTAINDTLENKRVKVCRVLGVDRSNNPEKYIGLPSMVGCNKRRAFKELKEKLTRRVSSWSSRLLSIGGREVLIRAVLQAILLYSMNCFLLPSSVCKELEAILARFWWKNKAGKKGLYWCARKELFVPKEEGGMVFCDLSKFNIALLAKQGWCIMENPSSLIARVLRAKYFNGFNFMEASLGPNPSLV